MDLIYKKFFFLSACKMAPWLCLTLETDDIHPSLSTSAPLLSSPLLSLYAWQPPLKAASQMGDTQGCTWSNHTPGSMLVQPWKARDKLKDKSADVDKHNMGSERRQSLTNPFQTQVSMITLLRQVHTVSLDEGRLDQEGLEFYRYISSMHLKV